MWHILSLIFTLDEFSFIHMKSCDKIPFKHCSCFTVTHVYCLPITSIVRTNINWCSKSTNCKIIKRTLLNACCKILWTNSSINMCQSRFSIRVLVNALKYCWEVQIKNNSEVYAQSLIIFLTSFLSMMARIKNNFKLISDFQWSHIKPIPTYWNLRLSNMHIFTFMVYSWKFT